MATFQKNGITFTIIGVNPEKTKFHVHNAKGNQQAWMDIKTIFNS